MLRGVTVALLRPGVDLASAGNGAGSHCPARLAILATRNPGDPYDLATWPTWVQLIPHLLAADLAATTNSGLRQAACAASSYLVIRGGVRTGYDLTARLYQAWRLRLGDDDLDTLSIGNYLACWGEYGVQHERSERS